MSIGKATDFKIYQEEYYGGMYEAISQNVNAFNGASANTIQLVANELKGDYNKESFLKEISSLISRRDTTSVSAATDLAVTQGEFVGVKVNRKIGPVAQTLDAWRKIATDAREMSFKIGKMAGENKIKDYLNSAILAAETAISGQAALKYDATGLTDKTIRHSYLVSTMAKMGDQAGQIACWVMHSKNYFDLVGQAISDKVYEIAGATIYSGSVATFGRPTIVTDAPALTDANGSLTDTYNVLGLVPGAVTVTESELEQIEGQIITGLEQLVFRIQGEYAFNLNVKGFAWDVTNGGANPTDATIGTTTNWDKVATSDKALAGVVLVTQ